MLAAERRLLRLAFSRCPQSLQVRLVYAVDLHDGDTRFLPLVRKEAEELVERPTRQSIPGVSTPSRYPFADTLKSSRAIPRPVLGRTRRASC